MRPMANLLWPGLCLLVFPNLASAAEPGVVHSDPIAPVILGVTGILCFALIGRFLARKFNQPSVLGELIMGIIAGNILFYFGVDLVLILREGTAIFDMMELVLEGNELNTAAIQVLGDSPNTSAIIQILQGPDANTLIQVAHVVDVFSRYGIIFLLFLVGLESSLRDLQSTGSASIRVAILGVVVPLTLGFVVVKLLMPTLSFDTDLFIAATLGATSVGISASVLREMQLTQSR